MIIDEEMEEAPGWSPRVSVPCKEPGALVMML